MAKIEDIIEFYKRHCEEILTGTLDPSSGGIGSNNLTINHIVTFIEEGTYEKSAIFGYESADNSTLRLRVEDKESLGNFRPDSVYFISDYDKTNNIVTISGLRLCPVKECKTLEICFDDDYIIKRSNKQSKTPEKLTKELTESYIFVYNDRKLIFRQSFPNSNDFQMFGKRGFKSIIQYREDKQKYFIKQETKQDFPKDYQMFLQDMECLSLEQADICEESAAKNAHQEILSEIQKGTALLKIWDRYSEMELKKSNNLRNDIGEIPYKILISTPDVTKVQCEIPDEKKGAFRSHEDDLRNSSMEVKGLKTKSNSTPTFKIKDIDPYSERIEFYDEDNLMPEGGKLSISIRGDEIVKKRRESAVNKLQGTSPLMRNILLAMEDKAEVMTSKSSRKAIKTIISGDTSQYLKEKFGIDRLTPNQEEAVRIALNTPDMAIIQGPPGTGKSTVIAAICHRLIEEAASGKKDPDAKVILVSAFQNDTVEHIASKIETMGLPTIKAGKDTQGNIRGEDEVIKSIRNRIDDTIHRLPPEKDRARVSQRLIKIQDILNSGHNTSAAKDMLAAIIKDNEGRLSDELWNSWKKISAPAKTQNGDKQIKALNGLLTTAATYSDGGYERIIRLQQAGIKFSDNELQLLGNAPFSDEKPSEEFLAALIELKKKHLADIYASRNETSNSTTTNLDLEEWLKKAIRYFDELEQSSYEDKDVFLISVLKSLREDLAGNTAGIRASIRNYGESLAATNQVAGGMEFSKFKDIQNVIMEEAARSNPLDLLIPITKATQRVILVGDQKQLPHLLEPDIVDEAVSCINDEAKKADITRRYEESLFNVFYNSLNKVKTPQRCIMLKEQFRMHPAIGDFISRLYYDGELVPGMGWEVQERAKQHGLQIPWAKNKVAVFCNVPASAGRERGQSKYRKAEAERIIRLLDELKRDPAFESLSVGVITFYSMQVEVIFEEASHSGYTIKNKDGSYSIAPDYLETPEHEEKLRIGTVDSFQGKEFDIVILSAVRSNDIERTDSNYLKVFGFLTLFNRLNVAFSRAKKMIIVVGDREMFNDDYAKRHTEGLYEFYNRFSKDEKYGARI